MQNVILEDDAKLVVEAICSTERNMTRHGHIVTNTQQILNPLRGWQCLHVRRNANTTAHRLAKVAKHNFMEVWLEDSPDCICDVILMEQSAAIDLIYDKFNFSLNKKKKEKNKEKKVNHHTGHETFLCLPL